MEVNSKKEISVLDNLPFLNETEADRVLAESREGFEDKIIVLDDDPTGVQTVHDISVYTDWEEKTIKQGFEESSQMFFILTNSRSFSVNETEKVHRLIAQRCAKIGRETGKKFLLISRGDSTLRGHYPLETEVLKESLEEETKESFDGEIICPFFGEGGRYTFDNIHYVKEGEILIPAGLTEFAKDSSFGYHESYLPAYIQEKTQGRYLQEDCICIDIHTLRNFQVDEIEEKLLLAKKFQKIVVNAVSYGDLKVFCAAFIRALKKGRHYMVRSAAGFPKILAGVAERPLLTKRELVQAGEMKGGIVLVGSHVRKTTQQLESLMKSDRELMFLEFNVNSCFRKGGLDAEVERVVGEAETLVEAGKTAVVYTSRKLLVPDTCDKDEILKASVEISDAVTSIIGKFSVKPRFIIAKGGITSSDVGTKALRVRKAWVMGQVKKGIPVWMTGEESKFPGMPYIIFPGNVGEDITLREIVEELM